MRALNWSDVESWTHFWYPALNKPLLGAFGIESDIVVCGGGWQTNNCCLSIAGPLKTCNHQITDARPQTLALAKSAAIPHVSDLTCSSI
jgi:hypothetical protein